jgi:hypothetical protein
MPKFHKEILKKKQTSLLPLIKDFNKFYLVGGTAIALYIGHRESIDFDLFTFDKLENSDIRNKIVKKYKIDKVVVDKNDEYTVFVDGVKITFLHYPFKINPSYKFEDIIKIPDLLTLSAMKAYALGRRVKWKDYVDLYFVLKNHYSLNDIIKKGKSIFGTEFNEKLFRSQLVYFEDIDYSEKIIFKKGFELSEDKIKEELIKLTISSKI